MENNVKEENLKIVYQEVSELLRHQQSSVDTLYTKLNWILVSDLVFLAALYSGKHPNIIVVLLSSLSAILCLIGFQPKVFKMTANLTTQLDNVDDPDFLKALIKKKKEAFNANDSRTSDTEALSQWSRWLLIAAILLQVILMLHVCLI